MMPCDYQALDGSVVMMDIDTVYDVVNGQSGKRAEWTALIVFDPQSRSFVELRSSPPDIRGGSAGEAEAVSESYIAAHFGLEVDQLQGIRNHPQDWVFVDRRNMVKAR
ncbi:MAG: hypothetical protein A3H25_08460 [Sphingomonadales bacterium RIFCSPLOWO2_12_FULL_63_15]|nr:MAG: hypothetical protein A3H25_08460 [Sphingomonadales bacterium RIFCSPLOWO2_12_FULL_63_15]